ncbi:hypothetical protein MIND_00252500 [Mycena indigotica]|uniref:Pheromone receptor n=1 Tax=Mycena indigotica TaxID=2126181 RepID=A0A8H6WC24_9AGAR|nr:uncharacterized protein MIND_00252500 [Mycena indigotica]KAF7312392.1 hypothetical protein MIND_00252500 [Mycena indigotica]
MSSSPLTTALPALPILSFLLVSFLLVFLLLLLFRPQNRQIRSVSLVALIVWLFLSTLIYGVDALVWRDSSDVTRAPIWCDITTKLTLGALAGIPGALVGLARALELLASRRTFHPDVSGRGISRFADIVCCVIFPVVYMLLHFAVQDHRFDLVPSLGCFPSMRLASSATTTMLVPPLVIGAVALGFCLVASVHAILLFLRTQSALSTHLEARMGYTYPATLFSLRLCFTTLLSFAAIALICLTYVPAIASLSSFEHRFSHSASNTSGTSGFGVFGDPNSTGTPLLQWDWSLSHVPVLSDPAEVGRKELSVWSLLGFAALVLLCSVFGGVGDGMVWPWADLGKNANTALKKTTASLSALKLKVKTRISSSAAGNKAPQRPPLSRLTIPKKSPIGSISSVSSKTSLSTPVSPPRPRVPPGLGLYDNSPRSELRSGWDEMLEMDAYDSKTPERKSGLFKFATFPRGSSPSDLEAQTGGTVSRSASTSSQSPSEHDSRATTPAEMSPQDSFAESTRAYLASPVAHALGLASSTISSSWPDKQKPLNRRDTAILGTGKDGRLLSVMATPSPSPDFLQPPKPMLAPPTVIPPAESAIIPPRTTSLPANNDGLLTAPDRVPPRQPIPTDTSDAASTCSSILDVPWPWPLPPPTSTPAIVGPRPARSPPAFGFSLAAHTRELAQPQQGARTRHDTPEANSEEPHPVPLAVRLWLITQLIHVFFIHLHVSLRAAAVLDIISPPHLRPLPSFHLVMGCIFLGFFTT